MAKRCRIACRTLRLADLSSLIINDIPVIKGVSAVVFMLQIFFFICVPRLHGLYGENSRPLSWQYVPRLQHAPYCQELGLFYSRSVKKKLFSCM